MVEMHFNTLEQIGCELDSMHRNQTKFLHNVDRYGNSTASPE